MGAHHSAASSQDQMIPRASSQSQMMEQDANPCTIALASSQGQMMQGHIEDQRASSQSQLMEQDANPSTMTHARRMRGRRRRCEMMQGHIDDPRASSQSQLMEQDGNPSAIALASSQGQTLQEHMDVPKASSQSQLMEQDGNPSAMTLASSQGQTMQERIDDPPSTDIEERLRKTAVDAHDKVVDLHLGEKTRWIRSMLTVIASGDQSVVNALDGCAGSAMNRFWALGEELGLQDTQQFKCVEQTLHDMLVLACSRGMDRALLAKAGMNMELRRRLASALRTDSKADIIARLGNAKHHLSSHGVKHSRRPKRTMILQWPPRGAAAGLQSAAAAAVPRAPEA